MTPAPAAISSYLLTTDLGASCISYVELITLCIAALSSDSLTPPNIIIVFTSLLCFHPLAQQQGQFTNPETPGYVGFANLPNQVHRKSVKKGFEFTLMVVGECAVAVSDFLFSS